MAGAVGGSATEARGFEVTITHHPSHYVADLGEAERFFRDVFGRSSIPIEEVLKRVAHVSPDFPRDYSAYTPIADVFFDSIDPSRLARPDDGTAAGRARRSVPHLGGLGWYVEGHVEAYLALRAAGYEIRNSIAEVQDGPVPTGPNDPAPYYTSREETGLRFGFYPAMVFPCDRRTDEGWVLPPVSPADPLGIERCSHHTFLTAEPRRVTRVLVDVLGGEVVRHGRDELVGGTGTYILLGDSLLEFLVPDEGTDAHADWLADAPNDTYHSIVWKVADLERAERHLASQGVRIERRVDGSFMTDPATSLGIPWGFTDRATS